MSSEPSRAHWAVTLLGERQSAEAWDRHLSKDFDPYVTYISKYSEHAIRSKQFDDLKNPSDIRDKAKIIIGQLNGVMRGINGYSPLYVSRICEIMSDGDVRATVFAELNEMAAISDVACVAIAVSGAPTPPPQPTMAQKWLAAGLADPVVADMLKNHGEDSNWFNLYKVYEGVVTLARRTGDYKSRSWYPGESADRDFRDNANYLNRYAYRDKSIPPNRIMSIGEARGFVSMLMNRIMHEIAP